MNEPLNSQIVVQNTIYAKINSKELIEEKQQKQAAAKEEATRKAEEEQKQLEAAAIKDRQHKNAATLNA